MVEALQQVEQQLVVCGLTEELQQAYCSSSSSVFCQQEAKPLGKWRNKVWVKICVKLIFSCIRLYSDL